MYRATEKKEWVACYEIRHEQSERPTGGSIARIYCVLERKKTENWGVKWGDILYQLTST